MATTDDALDDVTTDDALDGLCEHCDRCGSGTLHRLSIRMRPDDSADGATFLRKPYRVVECRRCGERSSRPLDERRGATRRTGSNDPRAGSVDPRSTADDRVSGSGS